MIEIKELSFSYSPTGPEVLKNVSAGLEKGCCTAILGNNGAGKSTLLKCLNRVHEPKNGGVFVDGEDIHRLKRRELAKRIAYVPQRSEISRTMVFDAVMLGRKPYIKWDAEERDRAVVKELMELLGLSAFSTRLVGELSGGELQKVVLARALAQEPSYLLLDEPTSNLDPRNQHEMLRIVREISRSRDIGVIIVIHDLNLAARYCDKFLFLHNGGVYSSGGPETLNSRAIKEVYGMDADIIEHRGNKLIVPL